MFNSITLWRAIFTSSSLLKLIFIPFVVHLQLFFFVIFSILFFACRKKDKTNSISTSFEYIQVARKYINTNKYSFVYSIVLILTIKKGEKIVFLSSILFQLRENICKPAKPVERLAIRNAWRTDRRYALNRQIKL